MESWSARGESHPEGCLALRESRLLIPGKPRAVRIGAEEETCTPKDHVF